MKIMEVNQLIYNMLIQDTGRALCDSGGYPKYDEEGKYVGSSQGYGRHYEINKTKTLQDFENEPEVFYDDGYYTISVFHYLTKQLELDSLCEEFNILSCDDFDGDTYGISKSQSEWLENKGFIFKDSYNTYNGDSNLSQVLQYTMIENEDTEDKYILLQTHNGCDIRGGYSDAKMFIPAYGLDNYGEAMLAIEDVSGNLIIEDSIVRATIPISNMYNGYSLTKDSEIDIEFKSPSLFPEEWFLKQLKQMFPEDEEINWDKLPSNAVIKVNLELNIY